MTVEEFASLYEAEPAGKGKWKALCLVHGDKSPSLNIAAGKKQPIVFKCMSHGCDQTAILKSRGLTWGSLLKPLSSEAKLAIKSKHDLAKAERMYEIYTWLALTPDDERWLMVAAAGLLPGACFADQEFRRAMKIDPDSARIMREWDRIGNKPEHWFSRMRKAIRNYNSLYAKLHPEEAAETRRLRAVYAEIEKVGWDAMWERV